VDQSRLVGPAERNHRATKARSSLVWSLPARSMTGTARVLLNGV